MKIKNTNVRIGFLLFLLSFTVTSMLNQNFTPQSILETPKTSDGEITIITPENKNYTEPMHGYYPATYGFENELTGTSRTSIDYVDGTNAIQSNCDVEIFNYYGGHYKVLRIHDGNTAGNAEAQHFFDSSQTTGTIEWWWFSPTVSNNQMSIHFHQDQIGTHAFSLSAVDDEFLQNNGTAVQTYNSYQWYHHKVSFDTISDTYDWYIDGLMVVNGGAFENPVLNVGSTNLKGAWSTTGESYFDAFGYSWSPDYDIGNNFYEGLLLSYEKTTTLDWQGYSLDGNANKTINGDTTIPIPSNGPHRIQVFGNDSMGTMYGSNIQYFSMDIILSINLFIPENKTYTQPMTGHYPGTFSFQNDYISSPIPHPDGFTVDEQGGQVKVVSNVDHGNVVEVYDSSSAYEPELRNSFSAQTSGTVEFWMMSDDVTDATYFRLMDDQVASIYGDGIGRVCLDEDKIRYVDNIGWHDTAKIVYDDIWYHVKIEFECTSGNYHGLAQYTWRFYVDGELFGDFGFENTIHSVSQAFFFTYWGDTNYRAYIDAIGYSWDPGYEIGDNIDEGLLLTYTTPTSLVWQGYSLDGNANRTITVNSRNTGNTTIPLPSNGVHRIQVFGNDFMGRMYESEIRYFVVWVNTIAITIISPTSYEFFQDSAPDFEIYIDDPHVTAMWYSLDKGVTCFPFTGFTGTIDQTEWDKFSDGVITIVFYVNNSNGGEGNARVQVFKENFLLPDNPYLVPILLTSITFGIIAMLGITLFFLRKKISPRTRSFVDYQPKNLVNENIDSRKDQPYFCPFCGSRIKIPSRFCAICGASLENL